MQSNELVKLVETELDQRKGLHISTLDVHNKTNITDYMVIVSATSARHAKSLADYVSEKVKENGVMPLGLEGQNGSDWVLLDLGDVIVHIMTGKAREYYQLEKLWSVGEA
ncbi:ribosome silencing factor [Methylomonas paludis]|uniref:Ribosomal silencing factor RsfS n=1 Tax=Methylomonas paludis TaxID=1173101 RepID=A0A975MMR9_9GAMM|nr:ribosome silencing factor [Methylomonas paludis]QWF70753.1 ribosome silencing factor [Methylomonas paludis]